MTSPEELIGLLQPPGPKEQRDHRPPWTWHALDPSERATLEDLVHNWVATYNRTLATSVKELVPPCWLQHKGLAVELPVMVWHWFSVHRSSAAQVSAAGEFYARHLPAFRGRVAGYLGDSAEDCRAGNHPQDWRGELETVIGKWQDSSSGDADAVELLAELHCGFAPSTP